LVGTRRKGGVSGHKSGGWIGGKKRKGGRLNSYRQFRGKAAGCAKKRQTIFKATIKT